MPSLLRTGALALLTGLVVGSLTAQQEAAPTTGLLIGRVVSPDGKPVAGARLTLVGSDRKTSTDDQGQFRIADVPVGIARLLVESDSYPIQMAEVIVRAETGLAATIRLDAEATTLPELVVTAPADRPPEYIGIRKYDDFFRRKELGFGTFRTRAEIERLGATDVLGTLRAIPGVRASMEMSPFGVPSANLRIARCPRYPPDIAVYIDGHRFEFRHLGAANETGSELTAASMAASGISGKPPTKSSCDACERLAEVLSMVPITEVELVEFYQGVAQMPAELARGGTCAAIVIWTQAGPPPRGEARPPATPGR